MRIHELCVESGSDGWRIEAAVDHARVYFAYSGAAPPPPPGAPWGDPFAVAALIGAMQAGTPLQL